MPSSMCFGAPPQVREDVVEMDRLHQELWARKVCIDRQDADLRNSRLRVKELEDGNFLQEQLNLSNAKLKSSEHARHTAESNLTEQANMLEAVVQMQSALESLVAAVQQQANDQQAQHRAAMEAQQQQTTELKLAFLRQANELAALQTAVARSSASRSQALLTEVSEASACTMQFAQGHHSFRSCRSTAETEAAEEDQSSSGLMPQATKPAGFVLAPQQLSHVTKDVLSQLAGKEAMAVASNSDSTDKEQLIGVGCDQNA